MAYKVFLVEDESITREGIRDKVDWQANGFEFCGEAPDGEIALPLLQATKPDVLITDIKMPFMDGLQLSKIVRERLPETKIIILSGHDEFEYAQEAIKIGVTEYLLKPVTIQDLHQTLQKIVVQLEKERKEQEAIQKLQKQVKENQAALREKLLLNIVVGAISPTEAFEESHRLGLDIIAKCYLVSIVKTQLSDRSDQFDYEEYKCIQQVVLELVKNNPDVFLLQKDWEELVLVFKGNAPEFVEDEQKHLVRSIEQAVKGTRYQLSIGTGNYQKRLTDIHQSFLEALISLRNASDENGAPQIDRTELLKVDKSAIENYLRCGLKEDFSEFFDTYLQPLGKTAPRSYFIKNYILAEIILSTAKLVDELGGETDQIIPQLNAIETISANITNMEQLKEQVHNIMLKALVFRDSQAKSQYTDIIQQVKEYIAENYPNPDLSLKEVAACINLSASHFSVVFGQEMHQNFKEYLIELRLQKAKELLRTTNLRAAEIAYMVGYGDPHYFSSVFKKNMGLSPTEFRTQVQ